MRASVLVGLLLLGGPRAATAAGPRVAGQWALAADPGTVMELRPDGSGSFAGQPIRWLLRGDQLAVTDASGVTDVNGIRVDGDRLFVVGRGGETVEFRRVGSGAKGADARAGPASEPRAERGAGQNGAEKGGSALDRQAREMLVSSPWCSFSYRATGGGGSGTSSSSRVVFQRDGTGYRSTGGETYSTGRGGQYAGARQGGAPFRWEVRGGRLLVDTGAGFQDVNLSGTRNSSGYPILKAGGVEYMTCR